MNLGAANSNVRKLVLFRTSAAAIPSGGGLADALKFLSSAKSIAHGVTEATKWVETAILAVRQVVEPNPWKNSTDEEIAGEILRLINEKKVKCLPQTEPTSIK